MRLNITLFLSFLLVAPPVQGGTITVLPSSGGVFSLKVTSIKEARFRSTVKQQYDFSCGSAALATLLTYHYETPISEQDVFKAMFDIGDQQKIRALGFSLLDMKVYLEAHGYSAGGYQVNLEKLAQIGIPAIVLINVHGYKHFVVVKGVSKKDVLLSDPAVGSRTVPRSEFEPTWNGLIFIVKNRQDVAKRHFNLERDWHVKDRAPIGDALNNAELANVTWLTR